MSGNHSLRGIKKCVDYTIGAFVDDALLFLSKNPTAETDPIEALINEALDFYDDIRGKINPSEPVEGKKRAYYNAILSELCTKVDDLNKRLSEVVAGSANK